MNTYHHAVQPVQHYPTLLGMIAAFLIMIEGMLIAVQVYNFVFITLPKKRGNKND